MQEGETRKKRNKGKPDQARVSTTDAEARVMKMPDGGFRPAYNVQFAAETQHGLVAAVTVTTSGADQDALRDMHIPRWPGDPAMARAPGNWLVDGGYVSLDGIEAVAARGSALHAPLGDALANCDRPAIVAWRQRMQSEAGKLLYRMRGQTIEWVNAGRATEGFTACWCTAMRRYLRRPVARHGTQPPSHHHHPALRQIAWKTA